MTKVFQDVLSESSSSSPPREVALDVLRGVSLVGVGAANLMVFNAEAGRLEDYASAFPGMVNQYGLLFFMVFLKGKYFAVFSLLFGISAALALESKGMAPFWKRAMVLAALGALQVLLIWNGDVLHQYALMSLLLLPLRRFSAPLRFWLAVLLFLFSFADVMMPATQVDTSRPLFTVTSAILQTGTFTDIFQVRTQHYVEELCTWEALLYQARIFGWLLLGYLLGEKKRFKQYLQASRVYLLLLAGVFAMVVGALVIQFAGLRGEEGRPLGLNFLKMWCSALFYGGNVLLLLLFPLALYVARIGRNVLDFFSPFGKMTLTHYLIQNLLFSFLFYGYGLGLYRAVAPVHLWFGYLALVTVQVLLSIWWLKMFWNGPFEKLVRYLTTSRT